MEAPFWASAESRTWEAIREEAFTFFESSFLSLRARSLSQITTRTAAEIASRLAIGLFEPLLAKSIRCA